jgi:methylmalonyl-CoA mutase cobalamin-binding subunit
MSKVLLAPLDPVHDNAIKLLKRKLTEAGHEAISMPPGTTEDEVIERALREHPDAILVSRTLGYRVAEILGRLVDLAEASGLRETSRIGVGGMAITRETGAELGFDATFVGELDMIQVLDFVTGKIASGEDKAAGVRIQRNKPDILEGYSYQFNWIPLPVRYWTG